MQKTMISVVGIDMVGIIAAVCTYLSENKVNILDISQTIVDGYFNMMMVVDTSGSDKNITELQQGLNLVGEKMGVMIHAQREEIFQQMHRI